MFFLIIGLKIPDDYQEIKTELHSKNQPHLFQLAVKEKNAPSKTESVAIFKNFNDYPKYPYEQLIKPIEELPCDVINESREVNKKCFEFLKYKLMNLFLI